MRNNDQKRQIMDKKKYFVFISYSSKDNEDDNKWAEWLRHELDHWHLPTTYHGRKPVQENLREVFRDRDGFCAGKEWDKQVEPILKESQNLIVICSPNAAKSEAVNKEVEFFINQGKEYSIFPFIVEGDCPAECFPRALKHNIVGGDVNKDGGRDAAFIKVVAGMLGVDFSDLYNRYELDKAEQERIEREKKEKLQISQSRFIAEKVNSLLEEGDSYTAQKLCLEVLPKDEDQLDRPYVFSAELALRKARSYMLSMQKMPTALLHLNNNVRKILFFYNNDEFLVTENYTGFSVINVSNGKLMNLNGPNSVFSNISICDTNSDIVTYSRRGKINPILIWHLENLDFKELDKYSGAHVNVVFCHGTNNILINNGHDCYLYNIEKDIEFYYKSDGGEIISIIPQKNLIILDKERTIEFWDISTQVLLHEAKSLVPPRRRSRKTVHYNKCDDYIVVTDCYGILVFSFGKDFEIKVTNRINVPHFHEESIVLIPYFGFCYKNEKELLFWNCKSKRKSIIYESQLDISQIRYCELSKEIAFSCSDGCVMFYDLCKKSISLSLSNVGTQFVISNDGKKIASLKGNNVIGYYNRCVDNIMEQSFDQCLTLISKEKYLYLYQGNKLLSEYKGHKDIVSKYQLSKNGKYFFSLSQNGNRVLIWNPNSKKHKSSPASKYPLCDFSFSNSSNKLVIMQRDGLLYEYDINKENVINTIQFKHDVNAILCYNANEDILGIYSNEVLFLKKNNKIKQIAINDRISAMCFNSSDPELYVGTISGLLYRYDLSIDKLEPMTDKGCGDIIEKIFVSLNGQYVVVQARRSVWVYDNNSKAFSRLGEYFGLILDSSICPNSRFLATYSIASYAEYVIRLWDLKLNTCQILEENEKEYLSLGFSEDGSYLRGLLSDGHFSYWETLSLNKIRSYTEQIFNENPLTSEELKQYYLD